MADAKNQLEEYVRGMSADELAQFAAFIAARAGASPDAPAPGVRQYVGARYVPVFADPLEWSDTIGYEPLTVVLHEGSSYTSRQSVPVGIDIGNTTYWVETGNYNAQIEAYRQEVLAYDGRITANANAIAAEAQARESEVAEAMADIAAETQARINGDNALALRIDSLSKQTPVQIENGRNAVFIGDSFMAPTTSYPQKLAYFTAQLMGWTMYNYAYGGSGWVDEAGAAMNFYHQIQKAAQQISIPVADVDYIVIGGGCNDWNDPTPLTYDQLYSAAIQTIKEARAQFPNAQIIAIPMMFRNYGVDTHMHDLYSAIVAGIAASGVAVKVIKDAYMWQLGFKNVDGMHPTVELYKIMAQHVASKVMGGDVRTSRLYSQTLFGGGISATLNFIIADGMVSACLDKVSLPALTAGQQVTVATQVHLMCAAPSVKRLVVVNLSSEPVGQFLWSGSSIIFCAAQNISAADYAGGSISYPLWVKSPQ
nr:MAG TPA: hypothetical protein [Bacteriophage sp.]